MGLYKASHTFLDGFIKYVLANYPELLNPNWQREQLQVGQGIYGPERILVGKRGFESLVNPHRVTKSPIHFGC
jgi:hypothetical protein